MKKIYYWNDEKNFGDLLNIVILPKLLNCPLRWSPVENANFLCIGSLLGVLVKKQSIFNLIRRLFTPYFVIGIGSIDGVHDMAREFIPRTNWIAVRGKLTKKILSEKFKQDMSNCKVGDIGLLTCDYYTALPAKKEYDFGIILHHSQSHFINQLKNKMNGNGKIVLFIDVANDVDTVITQILSCKCILSSSLHGLIVADSFNIPNKWISLSESDLLEKQNFKYLDYYSSMDIYDEEPLNLNDVDLTMSFYNRISDSFLKRSCKIESVKSDLRYCVKNYRVIRSYGVPLLGCIKNIYFCFKYFVKHSILGQV